MIFINEIRKGLFSKGSLKELISAMPDNDLYNTGKRMRKTLKDSANRDDWTYRCPKITNRLYGCWRISVREI